MDSISTIILNPRGFDYPIFRARLPQLSKYANPVFCFTDHGNLNLTKWIKNNTPGTFFDVNQHETNKYHGDWRNKATNLIIDNTDSEWLLSIEQDFMIRNYDDFFSKILEAMSKTDVITFEEGIRFHPAFILVRRSVLNETHRDFSVAGSGMDHWAVVSKKLRGFARVTKLEELGLLPDRDWYHFGGLTENIFHSHPYYRLPEFFMYNEWCYRLHLNREIEFSNEWIKEMERLRNCRNDCYPTSDIKDILCHIDPKNAKSVLKYLSQPVDSKSIA